MKYKVEFDNGMTFNTNSENVLCLDRNQTLAFITFDGSNYHVLLDYQYS